VGTFTHLDFVDALHHEVGHLTELLTSVDLTAPVRSCPGWQVGDLIEHLGGVHRWTTEIVRTRERARFPEPTIDGDVEHWFAEGAALLIRTLTDTDPDLACWTMAAPATVGFWSRRQAHEALIHRWDLATAVGAPVELDPQFAVDGIDEVVDMFFPRQVKLGRQEPLTDTVAVVDSRSGRRWVIGGDGRTPDHDSTAVDATVSGDGVHLLLLLWQRVGLEDAPVQVDGDHVAAQRVFDAQLTP
jgi:uncharacterized protein (TIGR03083 family)